MLYRCSGFWGTALLLLLCLFSGVSAFYLTGSLTRRDIGSIEENAEEGAEFETDIAQSPGGDTQTKNNEPAETEDNSVEREYGELYTARSEETVPAVKRPDIAFAISAQKVSADVFSDDAQDSADGVDDEVQHAWEEFLAEAGDSTDDSYRELYENIPDTLPEGYGVLREEDSEQAEESDDTHLYEEVGISRRLHYAKQIAAVLLLVLSAGTAVLMSKVFTAVDENGVTLSGVFGGTEYKWSDTVLLTAEASAFSDTRLTVKAETDGKKKVTVMSPSFVIGDAGRRSGDGETALCARILRGAAASGADIFVKDADTLADMFEGSADEEYIREIINLAKQRTDK